MIASRYCRQIEVEQNDYASEYIADRFDKLVNLAGAMGNKMGVSLGRDEATEIVSSCYCVIKQKESRGESYDCDYLVPLSGYVAKMLQFSVYKFLNTKARSNSEVREDDVLQSMYEKSNSSVEHVDELQEIELEIDLAESVEFVLTYSDTNTNKKIRNVLLNIDKLVDTKIEKSPILGFLRDLCKQHSEFADALMIVMRSARLDREKVCGLVSGIEI